MPRFRLQIAPRVSRPAAKFTASNSLVVLPFRDHSPEAGTLNFGDVISEEIIARLRHLKVAGPTAGPTCRALGLPGSGPAGLWACRALGLSGEDIHKRLGVNHAVNGGVARLDDRLVITFSITDLRANRLAHGDKFEGKFQDLFGQQSLMIDRIASTLFNRTQRAEKADPSCSLRPPARLQRRTTTTTGRAGQGMV